MSEENDADRDVPLAPNASGLNRLSAFGGRQVEVDRPLEFLRDVACRNEQIGPTGDFRFTRAAQRNVDKPRVQPPSQRQSQPSSVRERFPLGRLTAAIHVYGGDFYGVKRSDWDPENLLERDYDFALHRRMF